MMKNKVMIIIILLAIIIVSMGCVEEQKPEPETVTENGMRIEDLGTFNTLEEYNMNVSTSEGMSPMDKGSETILCQFALYGVKYRSLSIDHDKLRGEGLAFLSYNETYTATFNNEKFSVVDINGNPVTIEIIRHSGKNVRIALPPIPPNNEEV